MTGVQAKAAYRRACDLERCRSERLRQAILVKFFGGCGCRQHNCRVNYESGFAESGITIEGRHYSHRDLARLSARYDHEQRRIWDECGRLQAAFARHF